MISASGLDSTAPGAAAPDEVADVSASVVLSTISLVVVGVSVTARVLVMRGMLTVVELRAMVVEKPRLVECTVVVLSVRTGREMLGVCDLVVGAAVVEG